MTIDEFLAADRCDVLCRVTLKSGEDLVFWVDGVASAKGQDFLTGVCGTGEADTKHVPCDQIAKVAIL